jgi:hypothetical protein
MPDLEGVGDAVTGGVIGRALEPQTGDTNYTHEKNCLNCGAELLGPYCSACGQHAHVHRTLTAFFHDLLHGVLHFEGKIWRTLPLLVWKPGELTRRYIDGQRARFVSPIALFLFFVFLTFGVFSLIGSGLDSLSSPQAKQAIIDELRLDQRQLAKLKARRDAALRAHKPTDNLDDQIQDLEEDIDGLEMAAAGNMKKVTTETPTGLWGPLADAVNHAKENPELVVYKIKTNAYKFSWALIPISVPFVWLLFPFSRRFRLYDHTVFVTYSLCFMVLLLVTASLVGLVSASIASMAWLVPPFHMYRQLRGAYGVGRFGGIWRTIALTMFAFIAISLFGSLLLGLGAAS